MWLGAFPAPQSGSHGPWGIHKTQLECSPLPHGSVPTALPGLALCSKHGDCEFLCSHTCLTKPWVATSLLLGIFLPVPHKGKSSSNWCFASLRHPSLPSLPRLQRLIPPPHSLFTSGSCNFLYIPLCHKSTIMLLFPNHLYERGSLVVPHLSSAKQEAKPQTARASTHRLHVMTLQTHITPHGPGPPGLP